MARLPHTPPMGPPGLPPRAAPLLAADTALHTDGARVLRRRPRWARRRWWKAGTVGEPEVALDATSEALRRCLGRWDRAGGCASLALRTRASGAPGALPCSRTGRGAMAPLLRPPRWEHPEVERLTHLARLPTLPVDAQTVVQGLRHGAPRRRWRRAARTRGRRTWRCSPTMFSTDAPFVGIRSPVRYGLLYRRRQLCLILT